MFVPCVQVAFVILKVGGVATVIIISLLSPAKSEQPARREQRRKIVVSVMAGGS